MNDNTIEIRDEEIDGEEIIAKIRENIRRKQVSGELPPDPDSLVVPISKNCCQSGESGDPIQQDLSYINSNWDVHNNSYFISSHQPYIGKFLIKGRQLVHGEVCRYVNPMISLQTEFNASAARIITSGLQQCNELNDRQMELERTLSSFKWESDKCIVAAKNELDVKIESKSRECSIVSDKLNSKIELTSNELSTVKEKLDLKIELTLKELFSQMDADIHTKAWIAHVLEERFQKGLIRKSAISSTPNTNYFLFEERFRGSRDVIKQRQLTFLPYFEKCSRVLDLGCGRGEFLEILMNQDIGAIGVDTDPDMVAYCRSRQLEVVNSDAIVYLETIEDKSLDGIFIDQVVEHLEPDYLIRLLALCHQKMKFGYHIVIETVNPLSFVSFVNFYIDLTHKRPVHPETLQYLLNASGFRECEKKFFSQVSDDCRLKKMDVSADMNAIERKTFDVYNYNIEMLNSLLFGAQDYAVIGKK
jgi:SAM-dependent methyltransferase